MFFLEVHEVDWFNSIVKIIDQNHLPNYKVKFGMDTWLQKYPTRILDQQLNSTIIHYINKWATNLKFIHYMLFFGSGRANNIKFIHYMLFVFYKSMA